MAAKSTKDPARPSRNQKGHFLPQIFMQASVLAMRACGLRDDRMRMCLQALATAFLMLVACAGCTHAKAFSCAARQCTPDATFCYSNALASASQKALAAQSQTDPIRRAELKREAYAAYQQAAALYLGVSKRFPEHRLANVTLLLAGRSFMLCEKYDEAIKCFRSLANKPSAPRNLAASALYYCGMSYSAKKEYAAAYKLFKELTWNFSESVYAHTHPSRAPIPPEEDPEIMKLLDVDK